MLASWRSRRPRTPVMSKSGWPTHRAAARVPSPASRSTLPTGAGSRTTGHQRLQGYGVALSPAAPPTSRSSAAPTFPSSSAGSRHPAGPDRPGDDQPAAHDAWLDQAPTLVNWKFGGPLEAGWRGSWPPPLAPAAERFLNNLVIRDCTFHGWHDFCVAVRANAHFQQCTFVMIMNE